MPVNKKVKLVTSTNGNVGLMLFFIKNILSLKEVGSIDATSNKAKDLASPFFTFNLVSNVEIFFSAQVNFV
jgi:hypothetical protein